MRRRAHPLAPFPAAVGGPSVAARPVALGLLALLGTACSGAVGGDPHADAAILPPDAPTIDAYEKPDAENADAPICADVQITFNKQIPTVMLLVDQSDSMKVNSFTGSANRWEAVKKALLDPTNGIVKSLQADVRFGLTMYSSENGFTGGACPLLNYNEGTMTSTPVPPSLNNYSTINSILGPADTIDDTPTGESIKAVYPGVVSFSEPGPKYIVLATDGEPDTCACHSPQWVNPDCELVEGRNAALAAATEAYAAGIPIFVISVGGDVAQSHLQQMANAGAGLPLDGSQGNAPYWQALSTAALIQDFQTIVYGTRSCIFTLNGQIDPAYADMGTVTLNGQPLAYGSQWTLSSSSTLELLGSACDQIKTDPNPTLNGTFPCEAIIE